MKNHEKSWKIMKNHGKSLKNHDIQYHCVNIERYQRKYINIQD